MKNKDIIYFLVGMLFVTALILGGAYLRMKSAQDKEVGFITNYEEI